MKFQVITLFPDMFQAPLSQGVVGQACKKGRLEVDLINPRNFTEDVHQTVDDRPYGGGDGMVMMGEPLKKALEWHRQSGGHIVHLSPQGELWSNAMAQSWASQEDRPVTLICSRYAGVDQRFIESYVDQEISIGDYVLSGGELAALVVIDSVARFIPGVLGNENSPYKESFADGLLEAPQFTRPPEFAGLPVPQILFSGHHKNIEAFRYHLSLLKTRLRRPDLLKKMDVSSKQWRQALKTAQGLPDQELKALGLSRAWLEQVESEVGS